MENEHNKVKGSSKRSPEELFNKFVEAEDCPEILQSFQRLVHAVDVEKAETSREFYQNFKSKLQSWKCKSLWELLDNRANQKEYSKGTICEDIHALVIGCGPVGLRTAIELALLGAQVVIVEKRQAFSRNNVLHLWPFLLTDFRSLGAKKFYGKFCSGSIDHISIRRLQAILLKTALILGVKVFTGVTFEKVIEPISEEEGWKCSVTPSDHSVSDFELDVLIGADGKKNVLPGFAQIEMRGTLAIGVTANFVNYYSEEEARVEEISGIAYQFNPGFFQKLRQLKGISLENIVYYKDETHYFVMTALKSSLLERGVLKEDFGNNPKKLLSPDNINQADLISYVNDAVEYATKGKLKHRDLKKDKRGNADIAVFDFTSIKKAENSARIKERKGHKLLIGLVGDSLLEPFWPTGSGCARGVLSALDAAWMVRSFALDKPPLQILSERENIYRLLSGTSSQNLQKNFDLYTINPSSRYMHIPQKKIQEVYHLYDTDDPVNADFSLGSPTGILQTKGTKKKRVSLGTSIKQRKNRKHIKFAVQSSHDSQNRSPSSSSGTEDLSMRTEDKVRFAEPMPKPRARTASETLTSGGEEVHEITKDSKKGKKSRKSRSPLSSSQENQSKMKKSPFDTSVKKKSKKRKQDRATPPSGAAHEEKTTKRRSFFGFGRGKNKSRLGKKSPKTPDVSKESKAINETITATKATTVETSNGGLTPLGEASWDKEETNYNFSRNTPTRRSAREIIAEMEARSRQNDDTSAREKKKPADVPRMKIVHLPVSGGSNNGEVKASAKRATSGHNVRTPPSKQPKKEDLWQELSSISPSAKEAVPALSKMSPENKQQNHRHESHDIASAMRMAGLMAIATPLLLDEPTQKSVLYSERSWFSRNNGHVKSTISKYDSLTGKTLLAKNNKDSTPLRAPIDMVDGPNNCSERKPTLVEIANQKTTSGEEQLDQASSLKVDQDASSWQPTAIAFVEGKTGPSEMERAANERAMDYARKEQMEKLQLLKNDFASLDQDSTDSPVKKDFSSPIYQKTFIASVKKTPKTKDMTNSTEKDHKQLETPRDYAKEAEWRKSPALAKKEMERLMVSLTETMSKERAEASIRFLISMFRRIQRNPKEEKFRRIFKSRVKFKKYVWTVRNAKMFMFASGWIEVGSFLIFSANKNVREPLAILNRHLGLLAAGTSVQISAIKSTPRRNLESRTPRSARALPFSIETPKTPKTMKTPRTSKTPSLSKTPRTSRTPGSNTDGKPNVPESLPRPNTHNEKTPTKKGLMRTGSQNTSLDKRFSKSVPLDLDSDWDLEMEDPLMEEDLRKSEVKRGLLTSSALDVRERNYSMGEIPLRRTPTRLPVTPDIAIMEEIESLSNTLNDLMESMEEEHDEDCGKKARPKEKDRPGQELSDLCTTLDYLLDSSEEEEFDRDLDQWNKEPVKVGSPGRSASAFSKVPLRSSMSEKVSSTQGNIEEEISTKAESLLSVQLDEITVQKTKKITSKTSDEKEEIPSKSDNVRKPVSAPVNSDLKVNVQQKKKFSLHIKDRKNDIGSSKSDTVPKDVTSSVKVQNSNQYSLRPREKKLMSSSDKVAESSSKLRDIKTITKRKLPAEPDTRPRTLSDVQIQKRLSSSSLSSFNPPKKERPTSRNSVDSEKDAQDSKSRIQRKTSHDSNISRSKSEKSRDIRKDRPFAINKRKSKSVTSLNDSTVESKRRSVHVDSKADNKLSSVSKSKSEMNITTKLNTSTTSTTHEKKKSASVSTSRKQTSSSSSSEMKLPTNQTDQKRRNITRNPKQHEDVDKKLVLSKSQGLNTGNEFKKPDVPKPRRRPESSKTAGKPRENTGGENLSTSSLNTSLKNRPPTGLERTRSARARRRQEIAAKLESLETSLESLENSPNRTLTKRTSISNLESSASSTKKSSLTETVNEHLRSSLRKKMSASRTSSAASRSSAASGEDVQDNSNNTKRSTSNGSSTGTRRRSSAKRTPSNASLERKKLDGLLSKEEQELIRRRSKSTSEKPSARATKNIPEMIRPLRSKAVDISQIRRADSSGSGNLRRSGSFKAKNRRAAARTSSKSQDDTKPSSCNAEQDLKNLETKEPPENYLEQKVASADDSFDGITVVGVDTTDFVSSNTDSQKPVLEDNKPTNHGKGEQEIAGERNFEEQSSCDSAKDDLKMKFRLQNTGSWMLLDYEALGESPRTPKKSNLSSKNYLTDQSPRSSISSIETPKQETINNDDFVMRIVGAGDENASNHSKETGEVSVVEDDRQDKLVSNGTLASHKDSGSINGVNDEKPNLHSQNGSVKLYANGIAPSETNGEIPPNDPIKKGAFKKKVKGDKTKTDRRKSQSVDNLTSEKSRVTFEEIQNLNVPRSSTLNRSPKDTKKHANFPFGLRKKKSESSSELNSSTPETNIERPSLTKSKTIAPRGLIMSPEDKSRSSPHDKSYEKKKLAPFKMFKKRKSQDAST